MKTGVSTTECGSVISATLARVVEHLASTRNAKADPSPAPMMASKSEQKDSWPKIIAPQNDSGGVLVFEGKWVTMER